MHANDAGKPLLTAGPVPHHVLHMRDMPPGPSCERWRPCPAVSGPGTFQQRGPLTGCSPEVVHVIAGLYSQAQQRGPARGPAWHQTAWVR